VATPELSVTNDLTVQRMAAVFGRVSWQFTKTLQLQVGLRDNWDNNYTRGPLSQLEYTSFPASACKEKAPLLPGYGCLELATNGAFEDTVPTGKVTLNWNPVEGQFFYVFYARGYTPGGYVAGASAPYQPEHVGDYEIGWKTPQLGGHLQGSPGGYWNGQYSAVHGTRRNGGGNRAGQVLQLSSVLVEPVRRAGTVCADL
jgi:outer membrane receptor protein involved in Fe transport